MNRNTHYRAYSSYGNQNSYGRRQRPQRSKFKTYAMVIILVVLAFGAYKMFAPTPVEKAAEQLQFDNSATDTEKQTVRQAIKSQSKTYKGSLKASVATTLEATQNSSVLSAYVPVTNVYAARQEITKGELANVTVYVPSKLDSKVKNAFASTLGVPSKDLQSLSGPIEDVSEKAVAFIPANELSHNVKLLTFEGAYYLDSFQKGAVFRQAMFEGKGATDLSSLMLNSYKTKDATLKVNMTGVTALTRVMQKKLPSVGSAKYFSKLIGPFLADADLTHVSNEVSFREGCPYSNVSFCSPPEMIDALKDSGVDLVELTGNHNNDNGNVYNTQSINLYHSLGWHTFGGGLNATEAAKPYIADLKGTKVAFLGYNYPDAPGSGAVATSSIAGANHYESSKAKAAIQAAKQQADFVVVDMQYWECYSYPDGFVEFPECDQPIANQTAIFREIADFGADMVIGTQAHQPQTYELYKGKPIYYGLGNLYFEQTSWPGTERGIILTHYFVGGKLVQTKLTPTIYDTALQTHIMNNTDAVKFLDRLGDARTAADL